MNLLYAIVFMVGAVLIVGGMAILFGPPGAAIGFGATLWVLAIQGSNENRQK